MRQVDDNPVIVAPRQTRSLIDEVIEKLESNQVRFEQLRPEEQSAYRAYMSRTAEGIEKLKGIKPRSAEQILEANPHFKELNQEQRQHLLKLAKAMSPGGGVSPDLMALLESGKLTREDSKGNTLLENLSTLLTQEMAPGLDRRTVLLELVGNLARPGQIKQGTKNTCAPTTVEYLQATRDPAEYARIMAGLTSRAGTVEMRNGETLRREPTSLKEDGAGRTSVSRLYQAALMEYANGADGYDNVTDQHTRGKDKTIGLTYPEYEKALDALMPDDYTLKYYDDSPENRETVEETIEEMLSLGLPLPVGLNWGNGGHALLVVGMDEDSIYLRNPWGNDEVAQQDGPPREVIDRQGTIRMKKEDFFAHLKGYQEVDLNFIQRLMRRITNAVSD